MKPQRKRKVNQARALTYSTKKENCAVVTELLLITSFLFSQPLLRSVEQERKRSKFLLSSSWKAEGNMRPGGYGSMGA